MLTSSLIVYPILDSTKKLYIQRIKSKEKKELIKVLNTLINLSHLHLLQDGQCEKLLQMHLDQHIDLQ